MIRATIMSRKRFWELEKVIIGDTHKLDANDDLWCGNVSMLSAFHLFPVPPLLPLIF